MYNIAWFFELIVPSTGSGFCRPADGFHMFCCVFVVSRGPVPTVLLQAETWKHQRMSGHRFQQIPPTSEQHIVQPIWSSPDLSGLAL